jgi:Domain of unknown function (DUF4262)
MIEYRFNRTENQIIFDYLACCPGNVSASRHGGGSPAMTDGPLVEIVEVTTPRAHLNVAVGFYGKRVRALQLVHGDNRGNWPWDRWYRGVRGGQPILGSREPPE